MKKILFVCVENAGRSQMAEAFANHYGKGKRLGSPKNLAEREDLEEAAFQFWKSVFAARKLSSKGG